MYVRISPFSKTPKSVLSLTLGTPVLVQHVWSASVISLVKIYLNFTTEPPSFPVLIHRVSIFMESHKQLETT